MDILIIERILFLFMLVSLPSLIYALEKLTQRKLHNKLVIIAIYTVLSMVYFDIIDEYYRNNALVGTSDQATNSALN